MQFRCDIWLFAMRMGEVLFAAAFLLQEEDVFLDLSRVSERRSENSFILISSRFDFHFHPTPQPPSVHALPIDFSPSQHHISLFFFGFPTYPPVNPFPPPPNGKGGREIDVPTGSYLSIDMGRFARGRTYVLK